MNSSIMKEIVDSFPANSYHPKGLWTKNPHYQTIIGSGALSSMFLSDAKRPFESLPERIKTPDGDFFDIEFVGDFVDAKAIVVLVHGMESTMKGYQTTKQAIAMLEKGFCCCLYSFRGCNGEAPRNVGGYHLGFTADLNQLTLILQQRYPAKPMHIVGFSLGGNVTLKLLGELGELAPTRNIYGGVAASVPFDCTPRPGEVKLDFFNKIYARSFLKSIQAKAEEAIVRFPDSFDIEAIRNATSVLDYDEHFISKIYGFNNKEDYYKKCCSKFFLSKIRVPAISINARDDPFIREDLLPTCNDIGPDAPVRTIYHEHGGHGGFAYENKKSYQYFGSANTPLSNQEEQISSKHFKIPEYGWLAHEMARAVDHIHHSTFPTI